jgi:hypothetical protein
LRRRFGRRFELRLEFCLSSKVLETASETVAVSFNFDDYPFEAEYPPTLHFLLLHHPVLIGSYPTYSFVDATLVLDLVSSFKYLSVEVLRFRPLLSYLYSHLCSTYFVLNQKCSHAIQYVVEHSRYISLLLSTYFWSKYLQSCI